MVENRGFGEAWAGRGVALGEPGGLEGASAPRGLGVGVTGLAGGMGEPPGGPKLPVIRFTLAS